MKHFCFSLISTAILLVFSCLLAAAQNSRPSADRRMTVSSNSATLEIRQGERLFHTHCGRCHNPPEDLSPREARAVVRQMRVRANLSDLDERALLKFLAP
jgi:cytochrome c5